MTLKLAWWLDWFSPDRETFFFKCYLTSMPVINWNLLLLNFGIFTLWAYKNYLNDHEVLQICHFPLILLQITVAQRDNRLAKGINQTSDLHSGIHSLLHLMKGWSSLKLHDLHHINRHKKKKLLQVLSDFWLVWETLPVNKDNFDLF